MRAVLATAALALAACARPAADRAASGFLPEPVSNNAVAFAHDAKGRGTLYSFLGLKAGKTYADITTDAFACIEASLECRRLPGVPVDSGRLASVAATVGGKIYLFGGYTVAPDGSEKSTPEVFRFDPATERYARVADMPTPVDDSTAIVLFDRYIYLVSGWHDDGNVALTQVYDAQEDRWFLGTAFPGAPVFGQAGGGDGQSLLVMGGVKAVAGEDGKRRFVASMEAWTGKVSRAAPETIEWSPAPTPPYGPFYRMAASNGRGLIYFAGGGDNPYNYNGVGYDGVPARPFDKVIAYDPQSGEWSVVGDIPPSMDHRGLLAGETGLYIVGGLGSAQETLSTITRTRLEQ